MMYLSTKRLLLLLAVVLLAHRAQGTDVTGRVFSGEDSTALAGATVVMAANLQVNTMSGADGRFELKDVSEGTVDIQFVFVGYDHSVMQVTVAGSRVDMGDIYLAESANAIDEVVVNASAPMAIIKNDTVQYNASAFKANPDADVEELIIKMPGVVIQQGKIEAQGEPVRRIYVDGKLFFGTDPMAALKSLPADAVESIQLFDAPSEESRLTGLDDGNTEKAINIVTKTKSSEATIVKAEAGGGMDMRATDRNFRYLTGGNFSRFTQTQRLTLSLLSNNTNTMRFGDSELSGDQKMDANGNVRNQPQGVQNINGAGINYVFDNQKLKVESSYFFDRNHNQVLNHTENNYFPVENPGDPDKSIEQKSSVADNEFFTNRISNRANLRLEYSPSQSDRLVLSTGLTTRGTYQDPGTEGYNMTVMQNYQNKSREMSFSTSDALNTSLNSELLWSHRFAKRGRSLTLSLGYTQNGNDNDSYRVDSLRQNWNPGRDDWGNNNSQNRYTLLRSGTNSIRGRVMWAEPIATYHRVTANYTYRREWSDYDRDVFDYDEQTHDYTSPLDKQQTAYQRDYTTNSVGVGYALYRREVSLNAELGYQRADQNRLEEQPTQADTRLTFYSWQPTVSLKYTLQKKRYLRLRYLGRTVLPDISLMQDVLNINNPNHLRYGNPDLKDGYNNTLELFYNATNVEKSTNLTLALRASARSNYVANENRYITQQSEELPYIPSDPDSDKYTAQSGAVVSRAVNMNGYYSFNGEATYSFTMRPIKSNINLTGIYACTQVPSYYESTPNLGRTNSYGVRIGVTSNISHNVDFNVYSTTSLNDTRNSARDDNTYLNQNFFYSVNIIFWKGFVFNSVLSWRYYRSSTASDMNLSYYVLNAAVGKKIFRRQNGEIRLSLYDALNQNSNRLHYVRDAYVQDVNSNTIGRYATLRFSYRFNSMSVPRKGEVEIKNAQKIGVKDLRKMK